MKYLKDSAEFFKNGKIGIIPTDTIYGISASVFLPETVEKIYRITDRNIKKPFIILIGSFEDLEALEIEISKEKKKILRKFWPGKVSIILPCQSQKYRYLHRGKKTLALRFPKEEKLVDFLQKTGPLISTSANPEGKKPAKNIEEAKIYFGDKVDFYFDGGELNGNPSTLFDFTGEKMEIIRK
jgi:L-threonylcarbamoyladenylate synthase